MESELYKMLSRRRFLKRAGMGLGMVGLGALLGPRLNAGKAASLGAHLPHFQPRAKRVIHIFLNGGSSHIDTFDPKAGARKMGRQGETLLPVTSRQNDRQAVAMSLTLFL